AEAGVVVIAVFGRAAVADQDLEGVDPVGERRMPGEGVEAAVGLGLGPDSGRGEDVEGVFRSAAAADSGGQVDGGAADLGAADVGGERGHPTTAEREGQVEVGDVDHAGAGGPDLDQQGVVAGGEVGRPAGGVGGRVVLEQVPGVGGVLVEELVLG